MKVNRRLDTDGKIETRETPDGRRFIDGLIPYNSRSEDLGGFVEVIAPTAFKKTLNDRANVFALWAHDDAEILASTASGTLELQDRDDGLAFSLEVRDTAIGEDRWSAIKRGDVRGVSFGFYTERDTWDKQQKPALRTLVETRLVELSVGVMTPAYNGAQSAAALRTVVQEARSLAEAAPAVQVAPPEQAPDEDRRAEVEALRSQQEAMLELIKAREGIKTKTGETK
jgi:HK97 family phage prohead protease